MQEINFVEIVAHGLKDYCTAWGHEWIEKLKNDSSIKNFRKLFFWGYTYILRPSSRRLLRCDF